MINYIKIIIILIVFGTIQSCVKFDEPMLSDAPLPESFSSDCTELLTNNFSLITTTTGLSINSYNFPNANCNGLEINGNVDSGAFNITLSEAITDSRTYELNFPFIETGQAQIQFKASGFTQPLFYSTSGILFVEVLPNGDIIIEWCDIVCQATVGISNQKTSGRITCN